MRKILFLLLPFFLWTCGGGGGSTEPEPPQLPTVTNIEVTTLEDTAKTFALSGTDPNNLALTYSISTQPQHGTISISGGAATYSPNANYHGQDVIAYLASSTSGNSNIGTIIITITPVNDEPNTMDVTATTDEDNSVTLTLEAEEYDGDDIVFQVRNNPSSGTVTISGTTATYTPNQDWFGTDTFNFEAVDNNAKSVLNVATATITVNPVNDPPIIGLDNIEFMKKGNANELYLGANDPDSDNLTFEVVDNPYNISIEEDSNDKYLYWVNPNFFGEGYFTYRFYDGEYYSNEATVTIMSKDFKMLGEEELVHIFTPKESFVSTTDGKYVMPVSMGLYSGLMTFDIDGNELYTNFYTGSNFQAYNSQIIHDIVEKDGGGFFALALDTINNSPTIINIDENQNQLWKTGFGDDADDHANDLEMLSDGTSIFAGHSYISSYYFDNEGFQFKWFKKAEEEDYNFTKIEVFSNDDILVLSWEEQYDQKLLRYNSNGEFINEYSYSSYGNLNIYDIQIFEDDSFVAFGADPNGTPHIVSWNNESETLTTFDSYTDIETFCYDNENNTLFLNHIESIQKINGEFYIIFYSYEIDKFNSSVDNSIGFSIINISDSSLNGHNPSFNWVKNFNARGLRGYDEWENLNGIDGVTVDSYNDIVILGHTNGDSHAFILKINQNGEQIF